MGNLRSDDIRRLSVYPPMDTMTTEMLNVPCAPVREWRNGLVPRWWWDGGIRSQEEIPRASGMRRHWRCA